MSSVPSFSVEIDGEQYEAEIATVGSFHLGPEDHGIYTADIRFEGPGWGQGLPGMSFDEYDPETKERRGTALGCEYIMAVTAQIGSPEKAKGRRVLVFRREAFGEIEGFAALNDDGTYDKPFMQRKLAAKHFPKVAEPLR